MKVELKTKGMHCTSCERIIEDNLKEMKGVKSAKANYTKEKTEIEFDQTKITQNELIEKMRKIGYEPSPWEEKKGGFLKKLFGG